MGRGAFVGFSRFFEASAGQAQIAGAGTRSDVVSAKVKVIGKDFKVDESVLADFRTYLDRAEDPLHRGGVRRRTATRWPAA